MALRNTKALAFRPAGLVDAIDGSNAAEGSMAVLKDLIPSPSTMFQYVPRPASVQLTNFSGFTDPAQIESLLVVGTRVYGFVASGRFAGKSEPFIYDLGINAFVPISNVTSANCPTSLSKTGDWIPPTVAMVTNSRVVLTHNGYSGSNFIGWFDLSSFSSTGTTGNLHSNTTIDTLSVNVLTIGWQVGQQITGTNIPANTFITAIAAGGLSITISNAATGSPSGVTLTVTGGSNAAPLYGAGNTSPTQLVAKPLFVQGFNGRAYYGVLNTTAYSDSLLPVQITNASQALTLGDNTPVTAAAGLSLNNTVTGGNVQSLIAFKGANSVFQITGDPALNNLSLNQINGSIGTLAPNTITPTPDGLSYVAPDGLRMISLAGVCTPPIGADGEGVCVPFLNAVNPSRMCSAFNENVLRISVQNGNVNGQPTQEYWWHIKRKVWTGPHSFPAALIDQFTGGGSGNTFIIAVSNNVVDYLTDSNGQILTDSNGQPLTTGSGPLGLWQTAVVPTASSTYTENGIPMTTAFQTCLSPDNAEVANNCIVESLLGLALPPSIVLTLAASDERGNALDTITLSGSGSAASIWGSFNWGAAAWGQASAAFVQNFLPWHQPLTFKQMQLLVTGPSMAGYVVGNLNLKYEVLGYPIT